MTSRWWARGEIVRLLVAMVFAAQGLLPPAAGAGGQEVIDVLAIDIALRAVLPGAVHTIAMPAEDIAAAVRLRAEHDVTLPLIEQVRSVATDLSSQGCDLEPVRALLARLEGELLLHERDDERLLVPLVDRALGGRDATTAISRTPAETEHQVAGVPRILHALDAGDHPTLRTRSSSGACSTGCMPFSGCTTRKRKRARSVSYPSGRRALRRDTSSDNGSDLTHIRGLSGEGHRPPIVMGRDLWS